MSPLRFVHPRLVRALARGVLGLAVALARPSAAQSPVPSSGAQAGQEARTGPARGAGDSSAATPEAGAGGSGPEGARSTRAGSTGRDLAGELRALEAADARTVAARLADLAQLGAPAARAALDGFESASPALRRGRAWLLFHAGGPAEVERALACLPDPDADVRAGLVRFLGRADLGAERIAERAAALLALACEAPEAELRTSAVRALSELDRPETLVPLAAGLDRLARPERVQAARELASRARLRERLFLRLAERWPAEQEPFDDGLVAVLLPALGRALVDVPALAEDARVRGLLRTAALHPDGRLRRAAREALDAVETRLELFGEPDRAQRVLAALAEDGFERRELDYALARFELRHAAAFDRAAGLARKLAAESAGEDAEARTALARARILAAQAAFAAGDDAGASSAFAAARAVLDGLLAERRDLGLPRSGAAHVVALELEALVALGQLCLELAPEARPDGALAPRADRARLQVAAARELHRSALELQRAGWRAGTDAATGFDPLIEADLSPFTLVLDNARAPAWPARRALALRERLCETLGRVAAAEFPGFVPEADARGAEADPLADPERRALYKDAQFARLDLLQREFNELSGRLLRAALEDPCGAAPEIAERAALLYFERQDAIDSLREADVPGAPGAPGGQGGGGLQELRVVSASALDLARAWRDEGRPEKARQLLERMRADLDRSGAGARYVWGLELSAEIEMALGTTWTDGGDPERAEAELQRAVERLAALEDLVREKKLGPQAEQRLRNMRSSALVSLAVNANVKQGDPKKALAYFERAWELRKDEFMRVLRACYGARAGRADEARAILREVTPSPLAHYNMACTYALCGETELALDFLRREFEENQVSPGAAEKQRKWARADPDLASLRGDARFEALVGK